MPWHKRRAGPPAHTFRSRVDEHILEALSASQHGLSNSILVQAPNGSIELLSCHCGVQKMGYHLSFVRHDVLPVPHVRTMTLRMHTTLQSCSQKLGNLHNRSNFSVDEDSTASVNYSLPCLFASFDAKIRIARRSSGGFILLGNVRRGGILSSY